VAASDLPLVLEAVGHLDHELSNLSRSVSMLGGAASDGHVSTVATLHTGVDRAHRAMYALRDRILDSSLELSMERFEGAFRARSAVLQVQLQLLKRAESEVTHRLWPSGRFTSFVEFSAFLLDRLGRVNAGWIADRCEASADDEQVDHRKLIAAVAKAERALIAIGNDCDVISLLAVGASVTSTRFRTACRMIAALLSVPLAPLEPRVAHQSSLAGKLAPHAVTFAPSKEDEQ